MHATDLDVDIDCPACGATGDSLDADRRGACPVCDGSGVYNRYADPPANEVHIGPANYYQQGPVIKVERLGRQPIEDDETGGFDGRYGTFQPANPKPEYEQDMLDQLANSPLGTNVDADGEYKMPDEEPYNGAVYSDADLPGGSWPADGDLTTNQVLAWLRARGDTFTADTLEATFVEVGIL